MGTGRHRERTLPRINDGDFGPRIIDKDRRLKHLNNTYARIRMVSLTAAEEEIIAEKNHHSEQVFCESAFMDGSDAGNPRAAASRDQL